MLFNLKMEAVHFSKISIIFDQPTWHYNTKNRFLQKVYKAQEASNCIMFIPNFTRIGQFTERGGMTIT
jgi:hypothetical protein